MVLCYWGESEVVEDVGIIRVCGGCLDDFDVIVVLESVDGY